ncbi:DUF2087 domain-containing protein [Ureibacillus acetophenoni]|uniref:Transcriptional regulator n=1 Tax=Ureibacillus acetophenoni TaxID=614649 RepID=A0A285URE0_9BACL|nr:DUF2087 domain-containing protein [Ureibacillus acetophenoni]SOC43236.1 transcriptional regulator [Ureibacillus acetophenoni]
MKFQNISTKELVKGYQLQDSEYHCLFCSESYHTDEIYPYEDKLLTAEGRMKKHILTAHESSFHAIIQLDKKTTGLTDVQVEMLQHFYEQIPDLEIVNRSSVKSISTVRQHRFKLREKERQAKMFLALMQLINDPEKYKIHKGAKQVDERYSIDREEREKVLNTYFKNGLDGGIDLIPSKEKKKLIILQHILKRFEIGKTYNEKEVNEILKTVNADFVSLRRHLVEYGFIDRSNDGSSYWVKE